MKTFIINIALKIIWFIDLLVPKNKNRIVFYSSPDYTDNCRAMYEELLQHAEVDNYHITWVVKDVNKYRSIIPKAHIVKHKSIGSLIAFLRCKFIIRTHSYWGNVYVPKRQVMCVAWHGMMLKGYHYSEIGIYPRNGHDFFCVTSPLFQDIYSKMFNSDKSRFNITGLPRNDYLFTKPYELKHIMGFDSFTKIIIWMPTFRSYSNGVDGTVSDFGLPTLHRGDLDILNNTLKKHNYCLLLKLHPWALDSLGKVDYSNIFHIKDTDIPSEYSLYHLLGITDALISDYSSVWGDYLLLDKPMAFAFDDLEEYQKKRYNPLSPLEAYMPGVKTKNVNELCSFIDSLDGPDLFVEDREKIRNLFLTNVDNKSSYRFLREIGLIDS